MNKATAITEPAPLYNQDKCLPELFKSAAGHFRSGDDSAGFDSLLAAVDELEEAVESEHSQRLPINLLLPAIKKLYFFMRNQDVVGITDLLEDTLCPLFKDFGKGDGLK